MITNIRKAQIRLLALKDYYNDCLAHDEPALLLIYAKGQLHAARDMYNDLTDEECVIEEDKYGELELYFYKKED